MSKDTFLFRDFFEKHKNTPLIFKTSYVLAWFFYVYGFACLNLTMYWDAKLLSGKYAGLGFFTYSLLCVFLGIVFTAMARTKKHIEEENRAWYLAFGVKCAIIPLFLVVFATVDMYRLSFVKVWYFTATVTATEGVKEELKWLLADGYPQDQEVNINSDTLEWTFTARPGRASSAFSVLEGFGPYADSTLWGKDFKKYALEAQTYTALEHRNGESREITLDPDWNNPRFVGYTETKDPGSFAICDLQIPLRDTLNSQATYEVLFNGAKQTELDKSIFVDHGSPLHDFPINLPPMMRIENKRLVIRTNYVGTTWPKYCLINFPKDNPDYQPEPVTRRSLGALVQKRDKYKLFFALIPELRNRIHEFNAFAVTEDASFNKWMEKINERVAFDFLNTGISDVGYLAPY